MAEGRWPCISGLEHPGSSRQERACFSQLPGAAPVGYFPPRLTQCVSKTWQMLSSLPVCTFPFPAGLWLYLAGSSLPCLTLIGSPNFGYRSVHRDLEAQIAIVTESRALQQQLHQEQEQLYLRSAVVSSATFEQPGRQVKLWVKMVTPLIKNFF